MKRYSYCILIYIFVLFFSISTISIIVYSQLKEERIGCQNYPLPRYGIFGNTSLITGRCTVIVNTHSHSKHSDGNGSPRQVIEWHLTEHYTAFDITDHNAVDAYPEINRWIDETERYMNRIVVLPGMEWTTPRFHATIVFPPNLLYTDIVSVAKNISKGYLSLQEVTTIVTYLHSIGAVVGFNHPRYTREKVGPIAFDKIDAWKMGVDMMEIWNDRGPLEHDVLDFCVEKGIAPVAAVDMHDIHKTAYRYPYTLVKAASFTPMAIFEELKNRRAICSFALSNI